MKQDANAVTLEYVNRWGDHHTLAQNTVPHTGGHGRPFPDHNLRRILLHGGG